MLRGRCEERDSPGGTRITPEEKWRIIRAEREVSVAEKRLELYWELAHARDKYAQDEQRLKRIEEVLNKGGPPLPDTQDWFNEQREKLRRQKLDLDWKTEVYEAFKEEVTRMRSNGILNPTPPDGAPPW